jgi:hypothetical protein
MSGPDVVVTTPHRLIDHIRRGNIDLSGVTTCLVLPPDDDTRSQFSADLHFIYTKFDQQPATVLFGEAEDDGSLATLMRRPLTVSLPDSSRGRRPEPEEEQTTMSENEFPFDPKATARQLRDIIKRIHEDEDPAVMNQYRRFIRRNVSIFHRGYFTAYLFRQFASEGGVTATARKSVFVSAGRNRRVHARDLLTLFTSTDGVDRDDIGQIKVLDNYSFVEVEASKAQQAIDSLNGTEFRGRSLTVNFARKVRGRLSQDVLQEHEYSGEVQNESHPENRDGEELEPPREALAKQRQRFGISGDDREFGHWIRGQPNLAVRS